MADRISPRERSALMARVRSRGTRPEAVYMRLLNLADVRWRWQPDLPGRPDFLVGDRTAVFVNGCFWHGCRTHYREPGSNAAFWREKVRKNAARQARARRLLRAAGYRTRVVWEHDLR